MEKAKIISNMTKRFLHSHEMVSIVRYIAMKTHGNTFDQFAASLQDNFLREIKLILI